MSSIAAAAAGTGAASSIASIGREVAPTESVTIVSTTVVVTSSTVEMGIDGDGESSSFASSGISSSYKSARRRCHF